MRVPLPMALDHVNCFVIDDGDSWTVIDTGLGTEPTKELWTALLNGPFKGKPVSRLILTHHHPDHVGLAGWFAKKGAEIWTTTVAYLTARMLCLDDTDRPTAETVAFWRKAGMSNDILEKRQNTRPFNFADCVAPIPLGHRALNEGDTILLGGKRWTVRIGQGHAPDHATFWCEDAPIVIAGDQILPGISPNVSVYPTAPEADPLGGWIESCMRLSEVSTPDQLLLGGHKLPFKGIPTRLTHLEKNHHSALDRLYDHISEPKSAGECFTPLFKRQINEGTYGLAIGEAYAHLAHLRFIGRAERWLEGDTYLWRAV